jgi:7,8-dihydropterin-6-yl-methyl-4-(beta-D-ribofuranosyl)aminobenzene 5'-phosphate synthase
MAARASAQPALKPVERLEVLVLVDNVTDYLSTNPDHVRSEVPNLQAAGLEEISGEAICCAHHGLSLLLTLHTAQERRTLLFDTGPEGYAIERNGARLGVDFAAVEAVMLSHGHWDHGGGLPKAFALIRGAGRRGEVPCYLHPGMFRQRGQRQASGAVLPMKRVSDPDTLRGAGADPVVSAEPQAALEGHCWVSGEVPRVTPYERGLAPHVRRNEADTDWEPDPLILDERFLAVHVRDKGLVVISACSHSGIVNVLTEARRRFPRVPLHAVMGGFHLSGASVEPIIPETVRDLAGFGLRWLMPCHCTGWRAVHALLTAFGEEHVVPGAVGKRVTF